MLAQSNLAVLSQKNEKTFKSVELLTDLAVLHDHLSADFSVIFYEHSWVPAQ